MSEVAPSHRVLRFSAFEVDFRRAEVRKHGFRMRLQDQPFHVLQVLLEHPGELVTREELQRQIWPAETFVDFEKGLNNAIKKLRDALGDSAEQPQFIETQTRHGYRFIGSVSATKGADQTAEGASSGKVSVPARSRPLYRRLTIVGVMFLAFVATLFGLDIGGVRQRWLFRASLPVIHSLAVLPLANLSNDPNQEYFSDGMTDALITNLAQIGSLEVISRTSSMQYKQTKKSMPEIARELNVDGIIEGAIQRSGDRVRITAQLIHGPSDKHIWADSYERDMHDVFALERDIASDIGRQVQTHTTTENRAQVAQLRPINLQALEAYLQGNYHLHEADTRFPDKELRTAGEYFQRAIGADPNFAPAYIGLAEAHHNLWWPSNEDFEMMRTAAEKALELGPNSSDAHRAVGMTKFEDWDRTGAEEECRRAIALNANNAAAHELLGDSLDVMGQMDEGWREHEISQELDPNQDHVSWALSRRGEYDRAIELLLKLADNHPDDALVHWELAQNYAQKRMYKEWVQELGKSTTLFGIPEFAGQLHRAFAKSGYAGALRQWAGELERLAATKQVYMPGTVAEAYAALGDKDRAFYWLGEGCQHRHMAISDPALVWVKVDPGFASLRSDPRFKDVLRCMDLPP
jgi:TolB-like protein/DNA-binding winged helix-turn-helix (wHTH) protein